jgi:hypothetical protein
METAMRPPLPFAPAFALMASLLCTAGAAAQELQKVLVPSQDTSIYDGVAGSSGLSDGKGESLWLSVTAGGLNRRALLKFDLAGIPPGSKIEQVTLSLYESRARDEHVVNVHRLLEPWGEGASNGGSAGVGAPAQAGDATWMHRFHPNTAWSTPGGRFEAQVSASRSVGAPNERYSWSGQRPPQGGAVPKIVQDVQDWVDAPGTNHGWILVGDEGGLQNAKRFNSRENAVEPPRLEVRYQAAAAGVDGDVPLPGWALVTLVGLLAAGLARRARSG